MNSIEFSEIMVGHRITPEIRIGRMLRSSMPGSQSFTANDAAGVTPTLTEVRISRQMRAVLL